MPTTSPIVIDCDPGHDDALAILLAGRTLDVRAVTAVHGNAPLSRTQVNARKVLELGGLTHIPVAAGCALLETVPMHVAVELSGKLTAGMTLCDGRSFGPDMRPRGTRRSDATPPNADVAVGVDDARFWNLLFENLAAYS